MLKFPITYTDFDGNEVTEQFYFNLSKAELVEMEIGGGFVKQMVEIINSKDNKEILAHFKKIVLQSYGVRSEDGKRFIKNDAVVEEFSQTLAYDQLLFDLFTNATVATNFMKGVLPEGLLEDDIDINKIPGLEDVELPEEVLPTRVPGEAEAQARDEQKTVEIQGTEAPVLVEKDISEMSHEELLQYMKDRGIER